MIEYMRNELLIRYLEEKKEGQNAGNILGVTGAVSVGGPGARVRITELVYPVMRNLSR